MVTVGILIAFGLNNWAQGRQEAQNRLCLVWHLQNTDPNPGTQYRAHGSLDQRGQITLNYSGCGTTSYNPTSGQPSSVIAL